MADGYIRTGRSRNLLFGPPDGFDSLLFVDVDPDGGDLRSLREAPHTFLASAGWLLVRAETPDTESDVANIVKRLQLRARCGLLQQAIGVAPSIRWIGNVPDGSDGLVERARGVELKALLRWRGAVWESATHHFVLPSGQHASGFIKVGQAIGEPRDADVIASWLLDRFSSTSPSAIVLDSATLTPVALSLRSTLGSAVGRVAILNRYPSTDVDVDRAIEAAAITNRVVGVISVCASGRLRDRMRTTFGLREQTLTWSLDSLVDLRPDAQRSGRDRSWVQLQHDDGAPIQSFAGDCPLCRTFDRSILVPVEPLAFDAYLPTMRERHMLDIVDAGRNRTLWNACSRTNCIELEAKPDAHIQQFRPTRELLPIKIDVQRLLADDEFLLDASKKFKRLCERHPELLEVDLVLGASPEPPGTRATLQLVNNILGRAARYRSFAHGNWDQETIEDVKRARRMMVVSPGTVTGHTLQRALVGVQECLRGAASDYSLFGLTVHARPGRQRDWQTLSNSFGGRLHALFTSHLPRFSLPASPIQDEADLLERTINPESLSAEGLAFWQARREFCAGKATGEATLFWGQEPDQRLSAHSIFGDGLSPSATYAAVASAMHAQRQKEMRRPHRLAFELPAIFRSYYDPLIVASVLRWIRPTEAWWGDSPDNAEFVVQDLLIRANGLPSIEAMLVAELLVAAALGKLPMKAAREIVFEEARRLRDAVAPGVLEVAMALPLER